MLRFLNPAYLQLAVVLIFPIGMIVSQVSANTHASSDDVHREAQAVVHLLVPYSPETNGAVLSIDDRVWSDGT